MDGIIRYNNSLFIEVEHEVGKYYRKLYEYYTFKTIKLQRPSRGEHITIIPEGLFDYSMFVWYIGMVVEFSLAGPAKTNGNAIWFEAKCKEAEKIRKKFPGNYTKLHFCIGYLNDGKN
jgi:hypothetical protein